MKKNRIPIQYSNPSLSGYVDIALLAKAFNTVCCTIGAKGGNGHSINEYVEIKSLSVLVLLLKSIINKQK